MLYPLSYGSGTSARTSAKGSARKSSFSLRPVRPWFYRCNLRSETSVVLLITGPIHAPQQGHNPGARLAGAALVLTDKVVGMNQEGRRAVNIRRRLRLRRKRNRDMRCGVDLGVFEVVVGPSKQLCVGVTGAIGSTGRAQ
jgi:hypothetical protein